MNTARVEEADRLRAELAGLRRDLAHLKSEFASTRTAELLEANENLVLASLKTQRIADTAASELDQLAREAKHDPLTGLPERALMLDRIEQAIARSRRGGRKFSVLFLDLDHFKQINDTLGHHVGDEVLQWVARQLESVVRDCDTVSRHSGDEFLVLLSDLAQAGDAAVIAEKLLAAIAAPNRLGVNVPSLSASVGIAAYPVDGEDPATLVRHADEAMYRAKRRQPGSYEHHTKVSDSETHTAPPPRATQFQNLREANEQLVMAAMTQQRLEDESNAAQRRQVKFLALVAHELRNPLNPIRTVAELLSRAVVDPPMLAQIKAILMRQVVHMTRLVDDLLDASRVSTGKFKLECSLVDLGDICRQVAESCRPAMEARRQHLSIDLPEQTLMVHADPVRLTQIINNLLDNASRYSQNSGQLGLAARADGDTVVVEVTDDGIGIATENLPYVFDLYVQGLRTVPSHSQGLGIGLAVVRELAEAHGGSVSVRSEGIDLGSVFVVRLPLADSAGTERLR